MEKYDDIWDEDLTPPVICRYPMRRLNFFFLVDTSESMVGRKIHMVNQLMPELLAEIRGLSEKYRDTAHFYVSCLRFGLGMAFWLCDKPVPAEKFEWDNELMACGEADFGLACSRLEKALHRKGPEAQLTSQTGHLRPIIVLLSDGQFNEDYQKQLAVLKANRWFQAASKVAIAIGDDCDKDALAQFTGTKELVIESRDVDRSTDIFRMFVKVAITPRD